MHSQQNIKINAFCTKKFYLKTLLIKQQFVITHTIRQNEIPALLDS